MEAASEGEVSKNANQTPPEGSKRPKRQMKTPFQLEVLEKTYATEAYPSEATRLELSTKLGLTDRQLQMWFCHRRLKDKKEAGGADKTEAVAAASTKQRAPVSGGRKGLPESLREEPVAVDPAGGHSSGSRSRSGSESGSGSSSGSSSASSSGSETSEFDNGEDVRILPPRYHDSTRIIMERRVIACVEAQLGEPIRQDGPILGVEFDELPPGAFGGPIVSNELQDRFRNSYDAKLFAQYEAKPVKAAPNAHHDAVESKLRIDGAGRLASSYDSPISKILSHMNEDGHLPRDHGIEGHGSCTDLYLPTGRQTQFCSSPMDAEFRGNVDGNVHLERKRKGDEARTGREVQSNDKKIKKEMEKFDHVKRKKEEQVRKEMERQDRERRKEEQRIMREQQKLEEKFQREERREMERREKFMRRELQRAEKRKQIEERRREKEEARQKAAMEKATARKIAKESMELIEDDRLELMELAASRKGLPSILSLDYDTLENLESLREALCDFPPKTVQLRMPFAVKPWLGSDKNVGNLLMVWKFCVTFADVLGLWPFNLDEFLQAFHDHDSRLLGEIHIAILKLIVKDIEDVLRTPSGGPGTNQYSAINPEGGHPHIVEGAYVWGFDIRNWQKILNPLTWPEILRQFALSAGFGPKMKKKTVERVSLNEIDETKGCEEIVSTLRNGSAVENAVAIMQEKGLSLQRKSKHRLTPGTVKFAAYHVLALEGSRGLNVIELADKIQKSGLRDLTTSKTPEASISVALSRDPVLFERTAPSTYCVRPAFRKDPADAESIISAAKEKIRGYANGFLAGQNVDEEEINDDSDSDVAEGAEVDALDITLNTEKFGGGKGTVSSGNRKEKLHVDAARLDGTDAELDSDDQGVEIDESKSGESWVLGLTEGEYSDLSVEERLNALVALVGIANEGNSVRVILEERMDASNALKKQMWTEAQIDKRRMREEIVPPKFNDRCNAAVEGGQSPLIAEDRTYDPSTSTSKKDDSSVVADSFYTSIDNLAQDTFAGQSMPSCLPNGNMTERSRLQLKSYIGHQAEETYVYRSLPLGLDRRRNRYWQLVSSASCLDPGSGRIFVESPDGKWRLLDSEEAFDALLASLDTRGIRESHLHIMLQKVERCFKECVRRNCLPLSVSDSASRNRKQESVKVDPNLVYGRSDGLHGAVCGSNSDILEPSSSFRIDIGRNETEMNNLYKRHEDLQHWIVKECLSSSVLHGMAYEEKRCAPILKFCNTCLSTYEYMKETCPLCDRIHEQAAKGVFPERFGYESDLQDEINVFMLNSPPLRMRLIKAILTILEATVPSEALHSSWSEDCRKTWGCELKKSSSAEGLLQILTRFEGAIKRDHISADFETTEELMLCCGSTRASSNKLTHSGSVSHLPWIPKSTAAVALRLLDLDKCLYYNHIQKADSLEQNEIEATPELPLRYCYEDFPKVPTESDAHEPSKEENWGHPRGAPPSSSSIYRQTARGGRGGGRFRGKSQRGVPGLIASSSRRRVSKITESGSRALLQPSVRPGGQIHGRGRRTVRRRRSDNSIVSDPAGDGARSEIEVAEPRTEVVKENMEVENDSGDSSESGESDNENGYGRWRGGAGGGYDNSGEMLLEMSEDEEDDDIPENGNGCGVENAEGNIQTSDYDEDESEGGDEGSDSVVSGDYSE